MHPHLDEIVHYHLQGLLSFVGSAISKTDLLKEKIHSKTSPENFSIHPCILLVVKRNCKAIGAKFLAFLINENFSL
jgi:hypothetical protein